MNRFIDLCYEITKKTSDELWTCPHFFVFRTLGEYTQIDMFNFSFTILYKIRVPRKEIGLFLKVPLILWDYNAEEKKLKLERGDSYLRFEEELSNMMRFDSIVFKEYDKCNYHILEDELNLVEKLKIRNNAYSAVFDTRLIKNAIFNHDLEEVGLKLCNDESPLLINYNYGVFDVYAVIAPKICDSNRVLRV